MNTRIIILSALVTCAAAVAAQQIPGAPETNGLAPTSVTIYVNSQATDPSVINNGGAESVGVAVTDTGNVIVGWEDDAADATATPLQDVEAVWTMYNSSGVSVTPITRVNALSSPDAGVISNKFLSYFRADKSAVFGGSGWGPKIKANLFGGGSGMGASSFLLGEEVAAFVGYDDENSGDFPSVQLLGSDGTPSNIVAGVTQAYATEDSGSIRVADWDFLSNGNIVIVGESRQNDDLINIYGGDTAGTHAIYRIVDPSGNVIKSEALVSSTTEVTTIWHGVGVTKDGFAVRFSAPNGTEVRLFDNSGNPTTTNLDLATLTGFTAAGGGGRGDGAGFHGNGKDAYVAVCAATDTNSNPVVWVTVLGTNGVVRYSKSVAGDLTLASADRADAAIDTNGEVLVVFDAKYDPNNQNLVMGRRFDATGAPIGGTFYVSEKELPAAATLDASGARVAWRNGQAAFAWESKNDPGTVDSTGAPLTVVALRLFSTTPVTGPTLKISLAGTALTLSWDTTATGYTLESKVNLTDPAWTTVGTQNPTTDTIGAASKFYRLRK